jgi:hypothetical protein
MLTAALVGAGSVPAHAAPAAPAVTQAAMVKITAGFGVYINL